MKSRTKWVIVGAFAHALVGSLAACSSDDTVSPSGQAEPGPGDASKDATADSTGPDASGSADATPSDGSATDSPESGGSDSGDATLPDSAPSNDGGDADAFDSTVDSEPDVAEAAADVYPEATDDEGGGGEAAPADSGEAGPDGSYTDSLIVSLRGEDCLSCAQTSNCLDDVAINCEVLAGLTADGGPAAGESRQDLCYEVLSCALTTNCGAATTGVLACYCGDAAFGACAIGSGDGACLVQEERGLQTSNPATIIGSLVTPTLGGGMANSIVRCMTTHGCTACFEDAGALSDGGGSDDGASEGGLESGATDDGSMTDDGGLATQDGAIDGPMSD